MIARDSLTRTASLKRANSGNYDLPKIFNSWEELLAEIYDFENEIPGEFFRRLTPSGGHTGRNS